MVDLADLSAHEAARRIREGDISAVDLVTACLARIEQREPQVQAWAHLDPAHALEQAERADEWRQSGVGTGPLHGVPVGIKDIIDTEDMPTENGSTAFAGRQPSEDAAAVAALRAAGAVIMGKTVTTELASFQPSKTRNPHNLEHSPGGSSSGSAAAVAAGMVPLALGTQTGGSVIRPASYCGIFALKPTLGLISRIGVDMQSHSLDTVGVFARTVEDLGLAADVLSAPDVRDQSSYPRSRGSLLQLAQSSAPLPPSFAFIKTPAWEDKADAITKEAFAELTAHLGDNCDEVRLPSPFAGAIEWHRTVMQAENAAYFAGVMERSGDALSRELHAQIAAGGKILAKDYLAALAAREVLHGGLEQIFKRYDAILTPAATGPAPKGFATTGDPVFNSMWTYLGMPAVSLPVLEADGLPIGVQLVGPRRDDGRLLRNAQWLVKHLNESA